jgi:hypothetical protein
MTAMTRQQDVDYAVTQAMSCVSSGNKALAVRTFVRLLNIQDTSEVRSAKRGLLYAAEHWDIDTFEAHLRGFAIRYGS